MTEGVAHALIIERDQDIIMTGVAAPAPAVAVAKNDFLLLLHQLAKVQRRQDREIAKGVAPCRDTHLQAGEGAIPHQCPHPLTSDARQLTLLRTRTQSQKASNQKIFRLRQTGKLRWVAIHKSSPKDRFPTLTATELREKLLREKVKALRKSSSTQKELDADGV